ncbi:MAG: inositol monophosphatase family protein [Nitritalea sp.]
MKQKMMDKYTQPALVEGLLAVAKKAGAYIRKERESFSYENVEHKGFNDLVSYVDQHAERIIVEGLSALLPEAGFLAEEGTTEEGNQEIKWIIDPLDGTTNFVHGIPIFSVSIALEVHGELTLGVVYEVNREECFHAVKGQGAFLNGKAIRVSPATSLSQALIATGFPYSEFDKLPAYIHVMQFMMKNSHGLRRMGSAAVDLAYVACGRVEAYFEYNLNAYDVAAGALLVNEAGGQVSDFFGGPAYVYGRSIVAVTPALQQEVLAVIQEAWEQ